MSQKIIWTKEFTLGLPEIDTQHAHLVELINVCIESRENVAPLPILKEHIINLKGYVGWHFQSEEALMELYRYPGLEKHRDEHQDLLNILNSSIENLGKDGVMTANLPNMFPGWFGGHAFGYDQEMAGFIINARDNI